MGPTESSIDVWQESVERDSAAAFLPRCASGPAIKIRVTKKDSALESMRLYIIGPDLRPVPVKPIVLALSRTKYCKAGAFVYRPAEGAGLVRSETGHKPAPSAGR